VDEIRAALSGINISLNQIVSVGLSDILDILIVAIVIYFLLIWIKETRAWSLLKGFVTLLGVSLLAYILNLSTVNWIIANTFNVGLIALVVIFQPELRKALEHLGRGRFLSAIAAPSGNLTEDAINEVLAAVSEMSKSKTGALILIEQQVALGDLESTGVRLDARISKQLLLNIFDYGTPLHDGAVIVRGDRISAASCILPLPASNPAHRSLGTRHRAAIGATEESDAFALIVSEETGSLSLAHGTKLYKRISEAKIREILTEATPETKNSEKLENIRLRIKHLLSKK